MTLGEWFEYKISFFGSDTNGFLLAFAVFESFASKLFFIAFAVVAANDGDVADTELVLVVALVLKA